MAALLLPARQAQAQQTTFLITPYYGNATITSRFDHEFPTPVTNRVNVFRRHDGARWTDPPTLVDVNNCTQGVNCYDGHNGYDRVLAVGWVFSLRRRITLRGR